MLLNADTPTVGRLGLYAKKRNQVGVSVHSSGKRFDKRICCYKRFDKSIIKIEGETHVISIKNET